MSNNLYYCIDINNSNNLTTDLYHALKYKFDYLVTPLCKFNNVLEPIQSIKNEPLLKQSGME